MRGFLPLLVAIAALAVGKRRNLIGSGRGSEWLVVGVHGPQLITQIFDKYLKTLINALHYTLWCGAGTHASTRELQVGDTTPCVRMHMHLCCGQELMSAGVP